eukprot:1654750-Ditylum_brightwellii.AAC.1
MKGDRNAHSCPDGASPLKTTAGSPPVYPNKKGCEKDGLKPNDPKAGNPKNVDGGKVVGQSGSTTYVETNNETKKAPD